MKSTKQIKDREKEQTRRMKELRRELEEKLAEQLPAEMASDTRLKVEVAAIPEGIRLEPARAKRVIEALLFASSKPLTAAEIRKMIKGLAPSEITEHIEALRREYEGEGRSFEIVEIAGGFEMATKKEYAPWIFKMELQKKIKQVTQSALETLSILAYRQPVTRAEIEQIRGVDVSGVLATLTERGMTAIVGKKEVPGRPFLYGTTEKFLEHFGLKSLSDLPNIEEIKTLVENSVRKEELLGTRRLVENPNAASPTPGVGEANIPNIPTPGVGEAEVGEDVANES